MNARALLQDPWFQNADAARAPLRPDDAPAPAAAARWVHGFDACAGMGVQRLGGKALGLVRMAQVGLPVPAGFCVEAQALHEYLVVNGLDLEFDAFWRSPDPARAAGLARRIREGHCPEALRAEIGQAYRRLGQAGGAGSASRSAQPDPLDGDLAVAVRSSAVDEDSAAHSFAGQHQTFLGVRGAEAVVAHVQACWASLLQPAALAYRRARGAAADGAAPAMAVVVQALVDADCAGVAFARHPLTGDAGQMLVEACLGLGEGLVAGRVAADSFTVDAQALVVVKSRVQYKPVALRRGAGGGAPVEQPVEEGRREAPALSQAQVLAVAWLLREVSRRFGAPQDIEWAIAGGTLSLLQSRPITTLPAVPPPPASPHLGAPSPQVEQGTLWSRMDIGEIFTGRMTPLGISFAKYYQYHVHRDCGSAIGLLDLGDPDHYMGYLQGHVYLNVAYTAYMLSQTPPGLDQRPFVQRFSSEEVDVSAYANPYGERHRHPGLSRARTSAFWAWATARELATAKSRARRMVASRFVEYDRALALDLRALTLPQLDAELAHALDYFKAMHIGYLPYYINAFGLYGLLEQLCLAWLPGEGRHLQNRLKGDMSNLRTVQGARDLRALAQSLERYPQARALVQALPARELAAALQSDAQGQAFWAGEMATFLRDNGVRAREEMELTHPRWVDDPTYVLQMLKTFLAQGRQVGERLGRAGRGRNGDGDGDADARALLGRLSWPRRMVMRRVIALYCGCSRLREETRMSMITSIWLVRRVLYEAGRRLVAEGALRDASELAFLDFEDLRAYVGGRGGAAELFPRHKVEAGRRLQQSWLDAGDPPLTFVGHAPARRAAAVEGATGQAAHRYIEGLGTSRGRVRARARVIHDLAAQAHEMQPGEVIVTRFTDASWTPLFALAAGVVTDIGSMLSHSSIVARELGIASVVNTQVATARIRTGDWLLVDGEAGHVHLIEAPQE